MRRFLIWLAFLLACGLAMPALAQDDDWDEWEDDEEWEDEEGAAGEYFSVVGDKFLMGLNSLITWPADPVMGYVEPIEEFDEWEEMPVGFISRRMLGFLQGTLLGVYRLCMGPLDMLFAPITPMVMLSPEPRYMLFDVEHDYY